MYGTITELEKKEFTVKSHNKKQAIGIQVPQPPKIRIKQNNLLSKYDHFLHKL